MIYVTGDCHGDFKRFLPENFPKQKELTREDFVILCGDFGGIWSLDGESEREKRILDALEALPFTLLFLDGNHENFDRLYTYPVEQFHGGTVHRIRPHILHLMRGQIYSLCGFSCFVFGGGKSHDRDRRTPGINWWPQELCSKEEEEEALRHLEEAGNRVDLIFTHCPATSTQQMLGKGLFLPDVQTEFLERIKRTVSYKKWFFGHYHANAVLNEKEVLLYDRIVAIGGKQNKEKRSNA